MTIINQACGNRGQRVPGFLKIFLSGCLYVCVFVCVRPQGY